ncbi:MAG: hypothetical protein J0H07_10415 [Sphingobacteriales bacterium]|nr:hypothetical protein [Sphingobacteriales bacterium]
MEPNNTMTPAAQTEDRDAIVFQESLTIFQEAPGILKANKLSVSNAKAYAQRLLDEYTAGGNQWSAELDDKAKNFLIKVGTTVKSMYEKRSPFTQLATALSKQFTSLEAELDVAAKTPNVFNQIQGLRNGWAKWLIEEAERKRVEAEKLAAIEKERAQLTGWILQKIGELLTDYLFKKKQAWTNNFNSIILEGFEQSAMNLRNAPVAFDRSKLGAILRYEMPYYPLTEEQRNTTRIKAHDDYDFGAWIARHDQEMEELKQSLIDRLPAKKQELEEAAARERERLAEAERQRIAEEKRQEEDRIAREAEQARQAEIAKANAEEKKRLEEEARIAREAEQARQAEAERQRQEEKARLQQLEQERQRQEQERLQQEKEAADRIQQEKEAADRKSREAAELATSAMTAKTLFDQAASASMFESAPDARQGYEIIVTNPAGWVEIFQFWYQRKGVKMAVDKMGSVKLDSMKTFAEAATKDTPKQKGERIDSKFLRYDLDVRAINKKDKKEGE